VLRSPQPCFLVVCNGGGRLAGTLATRCQLPDNFSSSDLSCQARDDSMYVLLRLGEEDNGMYTGR
jgi:hypothetical protein